MNAPIDTFPAVSCHGLTKAFGVGDSMVYALRGVDIDIAKGELMMLVGPSGCGKTTLISVIAGILKPDAGQCRVMGNDLARMSSKQATDFRARHIGFIFQSYNLLPALSIAENAAIPLIINGVDRHVAIRKASELLAEVGLGNRLDSKPPQLSGGQQQRVAIARALVHEPGILVCDEPTSALDHHTGMQVMDMMRHAVKQRGATLVIVTHDNRILEYADRIAHMDDGAIDRMQHESHLTKAGMP